MSFPPFFLETQTKPHIINLQGTEKTPTTFPSHVHTHVHMHVHRRTTNTHEDVFFSPKRPKQTGAAECGCGPGCWWLMEADAWGVGRCGRTAPRPHRAPATGRKQSRQTENDQRTNAPGCFHPWHQSNWNQTTCSCSSTLLCEGSHGAALFLKLILADLWYSGEDEGWQNTVNQQPLCFMWATLWDYGERPGAATNDNRLMQDLFLH